MTKHAWLLAVLGLLCMLFHVVARVVWGHWGGWPAGVGGTGLALWLVWLWLDRNPLQRAARSRSVRFEVAAGLLMLLALGLAVGLNVLAHRYDQRWDLTATRRHSLAPQTVQILEGLEREVQLLAFFPMASPDERSFLDLLEAYQQHTDKLSAVLYDPFQDVAVATQYGVTSAYGTIILVSGDRQQRLETSFDEEAISNALLRLGSDSEHTVCFLTDHGESDPDDDELSGSSLAVMKLEGQNYRVERTSILTHGGVPEHCQVLVIANPQIDPLPEEREALAEFLVGGGNALVLLEPLSAPALAEDLERYGLSLVPDVVLVDNPEMRQLGFDPSHLRLTPDQLDLHPITSELDSVIYLQLARSVERISDLPEGLNVQRLARSGAGAWGETSLEEGGALEPTPELDRIGALGLAAAVEIIDPEAVPVLGHDLAGVEPSEEEDGSPDPGGDKPSPEREGGRLVVFGDAGFASNQHLLEGLNQDLLLNSIAWLAGEEEQLSIRPNDEGRGLLEIDLLQALLMWFTALIGVPGLAIIAALATWFRRRRM
jgi:ABC-type uncharacterized transport system involved in gliding motility auxiliary subunit